MSGLNRRIELLFGAGRRAPSGRTLRQVLGPVIQHGSKSEQRALHAALLGLPRPEAITAAFEVLERTDSRALLRQDDGFGAISARAEALAGCSVDPASLIRAGTGLKPGMRGEQLLLCALVPRGACLKSVADAVRTGEGWSPLAGRLLLWLARRVEAGASDARSACEAVITELAGDWEAHRNRDVLTARVVLLPRGRATARFNPTDVRVLERWIRRAEDPLIQERLVELVSNGPLSGAAIDGLKSLRLRQLDEAVARGGHLLRTSRRLRRLARSGLASRLAGRLAGRTLPPPGAARALTRILAGGLQSPDRLGHRLKVLASHPDPLTRLLAVAELLRLPATAPGREEALLDAERTGDPRVRGLLAAAGRVPTDLDPSACPEAFEVALHREPPWRCAQFALGLQVKDAEALLERLRAALTGDSRRARVAALEVVSRRRLVPRFEAELVGLVRAAGAEVPVQDACRALRLLPHGVTERSAGTIVRALVSRHGALQAEAIGAAVRVGATTSSGLASGLVDRTLLARLAHASQPQVRSAALRALQTTCRRSGREAVESLLADPDAGRRLSGLDGIRWAGDPDYRSAVLRMLEREGHERVKTEGRAVLRFLERRGRMRAQPARMLEVA